MVLSSPNRKLMSELFSFPITCFCFLNQVIFPNVKYLRCELSAGQSCRGDKFWQLRDSLLKVLSTQKDKKSPKDEDREGPWVTDCAAVLIVLAHTCLRGLMILFQNCVTIFFRKRVFLGKISSTVSHWSFNRTLLSPARSCSSTSATVKLVWPWHRTGSCGKLQWC